MPSPTDAPDADAPDPADLASASADALSASDLDAIAAALARLRGRRPGGFGGPGGHGGHGGFGPRGRGGPHRHPGHAWLDGDGGDPRAARSGAGGDGEPRTAGAGAGTRVGGPARMRLLEALAAASHPLSVSELGQAIGVDQPRASRLVQQAVDLGLVRREADPDDARRTRIALTDDGAKVARGFRGQRREHLAQALSGFTPAERAELVRLLAKLADAWPGHD